MELAIIQGFPAAVVVGLFWLNHNTVKRYENLIYEFKQTLENNTKAINKLFNNSEK